MHVGMESTNMTAPPPMSTMDGAHHHQMMMHMSFFWGTKGEILFHHWPGTRTGQYVLALLLVFFLSVLAEWLPRCRFLKPGGSSDVVSGLLQTLLHGLRVGLCNLLMLALMSFNGAVFLVSVVGHCVGFFLFGTRVFNRSSSAEKNPGVSHSIC